MTDCIALSAIDLLRQVAEVLQHSTIAEERGQDSLSKFWAAYKKVSSDYDNDMLERCNGNMDIVLIFVRELFHYLSTSQLTRVTRLVCSPLSIRRSSSQCNPILSTPPMAS